MYLPINEVSLHKDFVSLCNENALNTIISDFLILARDVIKNSLADGFVSNKKLEAFFYDLGDSLNKWYQSPNVRQEAKSFMRVLLGKYISIIRADSITSVSEAVILSDGKEYSGEGINYAITEGVRIVLSFKTSDFWKKKSITCTYRFLNTDSEIEKTTSVRQISDACDCNMLSNILHDDLYRNISSGQDLWENWDKLFPNLIKCENIKECLYENPEKSHMQIIIKKLSVLQTYFKNLHGFYNPHDLPLNVSSEKETVKTNPDYRDQRTFKLPDGSKSIFLEHIKFSGKFSAERIYFLPIPNENKCYVGYIGRHLDTKKFH